MILQSLSYRGRRMVLASSVAFAWLIANPLMPAGFDQGASTMGAAFAKGGHGGKNDHGHHGRNHHQNGKGKNNSSPNDDSDDDSDDDEDDDSDDDADDDQGDDNDDQGDDDVSHT